MGRECYANHDPLQRVKMGAEMSIHICKIKPMQRNQEVNKVLNNLFKLQYQMLPQHLKVLFMTPTVPDRGMQMQVR